MNFYPYNAWPTWVKFSIALQTVPFGNYEFCKNEGSESHTSLKAKNETFPIFFMFFVQFELHLVQKMSIKFCQSWHLNPHFCTLKVKIIN
jgi:hypothetical protein